MIIEILVPTAILIVLLFNMQRIILAISPSESAKRDRKLLTFIKNCTHSKNGTSTTMFNPNEPDITVTGKYSSRGEIWQLIIFNHTQKNSVIIDSSNNDIFDLLAEAYTKNRNKSYAASLEKERIDKVNDMKKLVDEILP